jgi:hypothetical protein
MTVLCQPVYDSCNLWKNGFSGSKLFRVIQAAEDDVAFQLGCSAFTTSVWFCVQEKIDILSSTRIGPLLAFG